MRALRPLYEIKHSLIPRKLPLLPLAKYPYVIQTPRDAA